MKWAAFGLCVALLCVMQGCAPQTDASDVSLDLSGRVLLEGEDDHSGVGVRVAFDDGALVGQVFSDAQGDFVFRNVPQQSFRLTFSKEGFDTQADVVAVFQGGGFVINEGQTVTLRPDRSASLSGELQSPLSVGDWNASASITLSGNGPTVSVAPNGDGGFEFRDLRPGTYGFEVRAEGHLPYSTVVSLQTDQSFAFDAPIVLTPQAQDAAQAVVLRGRVDLEGADNDGGVQVRVEIGDALFATVNTDSEGYFALQTSRLEHQLSFFKEGYRRVSGQSEVTAVWSEDAERFEVDGQGLETLVFELEALPTASVSGVVSSTLGSLSDWSLRAFATLVSVGGEVRRIEPMADGEEGQGQFQFAALPPGDYALNIQAQGHAPFRRSVTLMEGDNALEPIELEHQTTGDEPLVVLSGRVCRGACDEGVDHSGILVRASIGANPAGVAISGEDGRFALLTAEDNHRLAFLADGYVNQDMDVLWNEAERGFFVGDQPLEDAAVNLFAVASASLSGQVVSSQGGRNDWPNIAFATLRGERTDRTVTVFNDDGGRGQFQFEAVPPGTYSLSISAQGHRFFAAQVALPEGDNALGDVLESGVIELSVLDGDDAVSMRGRVLLDGQDPQTGDHSGTLVRAVVEGNLVGTALTDRTGAFVLSVSGQNHTLDFARPGHIDLRGVEVLWDEVEERFEIQGEALEAYQGLRLESLTGALEVSVVVEPQWLPLEQRAVTVTLVGAGREDSAVVNGAPVTFTDLPAGEYIVQAQRTGFSQAVALVTIDQPQALVQTQLTVSLEDLAASGLNLSGISLTGSDLRGVARLVGANLANVSLANADLCGLDLTGVSLAGANLAGAVLAGAELSGARLDNAVLEGADLRSANLSAASFFGANLQNADLRNGAPLCQGQPLPDRRTLLTRANFSSAALNNALFVDGQLPEGQEAPCVQAPLSSPNMSGTRWTQADLSGAVLHSADLVGADLTGAVAQGTNLQGACLRDATIVRAGLGSAQLQGADLSGASILDAFLGEADLTGANLSETTLSGTNLIRANLAGVDGRGMNVSGAITDEMSLVGADLTGSRWFGGIFIGVDLSGADLSDADLRNAQFIDVLLDDVSMARADLGNVSLVDASLVGGDFSDARLQRADLSGAALDGTIFTGANLSETAFELAFYNSATQWPEGFEFRTILALGPETQMAGYLFPDEFDAAGAELVGADFSGARMRGMDLSGAVLFGANLEESDLTGADLTGAEPEGMRGVGLVGCPAVDPEGWQCVSGFDGALVLAGRGADLSGIERFIGADFRGLDLSGANFTNSDLGNAQFQDTDLVGADFTGADLGGADFSRADCTGAIFDNAVLTGVNFSFGNLTDASIFYVDMEGARLSSVTLMGLRAQELRKCPLEVFLPSEWRCTGRFGRYVLVGPDADLSGAYMLDSFFDGASLENANLDRARTVDLMDCPSALPERWQCIAQPANGRFMLIGPRADISGARVDGAQLAGTEFERPRAINVFGCPASLPEQFSCVPLNNGRSVLIGPQADLIAVDFDGVDLSSVALDRVQAHNLDDCPAALPEPWRCVFLPQQESDFALLGPSVDLSGVNLTDVQLINVDLTGAIFDDKTVCPDGTPHTEQPGCGL